MIFIFSSPRSGSTWLAKTFASHPNTRYLHEPDIVDRGEDLLPFWFADEPAGYEENARQYLLRLTSNRSLRAMGVPPFFRKHYRSEFHRRLRAALIYTGKGIEKAGFNSLTRRITVPDLVKPDFAGRAPTVIVKSVSALGRAEAFLRCGYPIKAILLLRHPCGYVHSYLQGVRMGVMSWHGGLGGLLMNTRSAHRLNAQAAVQDNSSLVDFLAWEWLLANAEAYAAVSRSGGIILHYDELAHEPEPKMQALFAKLGLEWPDSTSQFLRQAASGDGSYYSISRSAGAADRWTSQMRKEDVEQVRAIVCRDEIGRRFLD